MARLEGWDDALGAAEAMERDQRLVVGDADIFGAAEVLQVRMLGAHAGVVEAGTDAVRLHDLAVLVLQQVGAVAVQNAGCAGRERCGVFTAGQALTRRLHADEARALERDVGVEQPHGVAAAAHAGNHRVGLRTGWPAQFRDHLRHLLQALVADDALEVAHHRRIRVRPGHGADDVEGVFDVRHPVAQGLVERVLERAAAAVHRHHLRAQQVHAIDVGALALDILAAHVDHALHAVARTDGGGGDAVLAGARLRNDARLAHAAGQQRLADGVVHLVCAGMVEVLALEVDLRAAEFARQARGVVDGARPADEVRQLMSELTLELGVDLVPRVGRLELAQRVHERLGHEGAAVGAEVPAGIGLLVGKHGSGSRWCPAAPAGDRERGDAFSALRRTQSRPGRRPRARPGRTDASGQHP